MLKKVKFKDRMKGTGLLLVQVNSLFFANLIVCLNFLMAYFDLGSALFFSIFTVIFYVDTVIKVLNIAEKVGFKIKK
jgi:hypothetical protein